MNASRAPLYGLLLSGGASQRMRQDKAALAYRGEPQLLRAWRLLESVTERAFVSVRDNQREDSLRAGLPQIVDSYDAIGPAAGILSAQDRHPEAAWLVLACDLPLLDSKTLQRLIDARDPHADATVFNSSHDGLPEPLCAIWEPRAAKPLQEYQDEGKTCPRKFLIRQGGMVLEPVDARALDNVNTPQEYQEAVNMLDS